MEWLKLMTPKRFGDQNMMGTPDQNRDNFEVDHDRVVFSTPFRRLQDKTQVIPVPESDFVHTRLTHSLEVSCVGRSLGKIAGTHIIDQYPELKKEHGLTNSQFGAIVAAASLAHDIGNPPFGHSGEKAISEYFLYGKGKDFQKGLRPEEWQDLAHFEGNANGFRILTNASDTLDGGIRLTYPTLAAFTKYPKASLPEKKESKRASDKKFGFFSTEVKQFEEIAETLGIPRKYGAKEANWHRHPLAFLVEAADDICYSIIDFEDGVRLGLVPDNVYEEYLMAIIGDDLDESRYHDIPSDTEKYGYLRAKAINKLINDLAAIFINNEKEILQGEFDSSLLTKSHYREAVKAIKELSLEKVYRARSVLEIESAGFEVLGGLLDIFLRCGKGDSHHHEKNLQLLPKPFVDHAQDHSFRKIISICEYVAGMTDSSAISLYRKLKGIELPRM